MKGLVFLLFLSPFLAQATGAIPAGTYLADNDKVVKISDQEKKGVRQIEILNQKSNQSIQLIVKTSENKYLTGDAFYKDVDKNGTINRLHIDNWEKLFNTMRLQRNLDLAKDTRVDDFKLQQVFGTQTKAKTVTKDNYSGQTYCGFHKKTNEKLCITHVGKKIKGDLFDNHVDNQLIATHQPANETGLKVVVQKRNAYSMNAGSILNPAHYSFEPAVRKLSWVQKFTLPQQSSRSHAGEMGIESAQMAH